MKKKEHIIDRIEPDSIAMEMDIEAGDVLLQINNEWIEDVFDYQFLSVDEYIEVLIRKKSGEEWLLEIEKDYGENLGLIFEDGLMDEYKTCRNNCVFCFVDQMPEGMRDTLYFKDDDYRLSFLQGNFVTLTNMTEEDVDRIIKYRLEPLNISFQTTNPKLRNKMLHNRFAGRALKLVDRLYEGGIEMNGQVVLCKGINDGAELERTISDVSKYAPLLKSISIVPVGLSKFRDDLTPLEAFNKEDAREVISIIKKYQDKMMEEYGYHFVQASDEWYFLADAPYPEEERYDGYLQLGNGVGMARTFIEEAKREVEKLEKDGFEYTRTKEITFVTGEFMIKIVRELLDFVLERFPIDHYHVYEVLNNYFGREITVTGLLTGTDIIDQIKDKEIGSVLYLPENVLRSGEDVFLDNIHLNEVADALQVPVDIVKSSGCDFIDILLGVRE